MSFSIHNSYVADARIPGKAYTESSSPDLVDLKQLVLVISQSILDPLHNGKNFLLLQPPADDLNSNGETVHILGVVQLIRALGDAVELFDVEVRGKLVQVLVYVGHGDDAGGVIELRTPLVEYCNSTQPMQDSPG